MLGPPLALRTIPLVYVGGMIERRIPRVSISVSAYGISGRMFTSTRSRPVVGPWKYPWSIASMTVLPVSGLNMLDSRFFSPQSSEFDPFKKNGSLFAGTST